MPAKIALVAGAGRGLGQATAVALASAGYTVVGVDRDEVALKDLPEGIRQEVADVTDPAVPKPLIDRLVREVGPPTVLVNTVGAYALGDAMSTTPDTLKLMMDVNLGPALWLTQAVAPHMQQQGGGAIVHVAARPGVEPSAGVAAYGVSKAALVHLTKTLDRELRPQGIRVNVLAPDVIATAKNKALFPPEMLASAVDPEVIAEVIAFLVSEAAASVSGTVVPTYGG